MKFSERMVDLLEQGWEASKEFAIKTGAKAQDLGEKGLLMWDIKQLENKAQKFLTRLGNEAYKTFTENDKPVIERDSIEIKALLDDLAIIKEQIEKKEQELKNRG
ncbi:MAG: hypothetical protein FWD47_03745 [Treponema sp.]|nr:hypothetical protein [Treponema sp.]